MAPNSLPITTGVQSWKKIEQQISKQQEPDQSDRDKNLVTWIYDQYKKMQDARGPYARQWSYNLAFYEGNHYVSTTRYVAGANGALALVSQKVPPHRVRTVTNFCRAIVRMEQSYFTSQEPTATVLPATGEDSDMMAAQSAQQLWESSYRRLKIKQKWVNNSFWFVTTGNAFFKTCWDNSIKAVNQDTVLKYGEQTQLLPSDGDACIEIVTPFHLFVPDLLEIDIQNQPYVFQMFTKPVPWARKFYKDTSINADVCAANEIQDAAYFSKAANRNNAKPDSVLVLECWIKPGFVEQFPEGGLVTVADKKIVGTPIMKFPYTHGEYPFQHARAIETGKFYGDSILVDAIPLNKEYNKTNNQIIEEKQRTARNQLLIAEGSVDVNRMSSEPGAMIMYKPGYPVPTPLQGMPIPSFVMEHGNVIKSDIENLTGLHDASRGQSPGGGVTAATAIGFLQERDDSLRATGFASVEAMFESMARQYLALYVDYVPVPRLIRVVGTDMAFNVLELKGSDIAGGLDIQMEGGSALPQSKQARQATLMDLFRTGAIDRDELLLRLDFGGVKSIQESLRVDQAEAQRENLRFKNLSDEEMQRYEQEAFAKSMQGPDWESDPETGLPLEPPLIIPVQEWQNHNVHIKVHNDFRKSNDFEMLDDKIKEYMQQHVAQHQQMMQDEMMKQAMMGVPPVPGAEQPGGESPLEAGMQEGMENVGSGI